NPLNVILKSELEAKDGCLRLDSFHVTAGEASLNVSGYAGIDENNLKASVTLMIPRIEQISLPLGIPALRGYADLETLIDGNLLYPNALLKARARDIHYGDLRVGDLNLDASLDAKGVLTIHPLNLARDTSSLIIEGTLALFEEGSLTPKDDPLFTATARGDPVQIRDFSDAASGKLTLSADLGGTLRNPSGNLEIRGKKIETDFQQIESAHLYASVEGGGIEVTSFEAVLDAGNRIEGSGRIGFDQSFQGELSTGGISFASLNLPGVGDIVDGTIIFHISGSGTLSDPNLEGKFSFRNLLISNEAYHDVEAELSLKKNIARLWARSDFLIDAYYNFDNADYSLLMEGDSVNIAPFLLMAGIRDLKGNLSAKVNAAGNAAAPLNSAGRAELHNVAIESVDFGSVIADEAFITFDTRTISLEKTTLRLPMGQFLTLEGSLNLDGPVSIVADGEFPLSLTGIFTENIDDFTGSASFSGKIGGTLAEPEMNADLAILDGGFRVYSAFSPAFHGINGSISLRNSIITIESLGGFMESGKFDVDGTMVLSDMRPADMNITLKGNELPINIPDMMNARLNALMTLSGKDFRFNLAGDITILDALYYRDVRLRHITDAITTAAQPAPPKAPETTDSLADSTGVNLSIRHRAPLSVNNNIAHLEIVPDLHVRGTLANPVLSGRLFVQSGTIYYQRREFEVKRGIVDFINPYRTEATLDIESTVSIRQRLITLRAEGPADLLVFSLKSDPPEEQSDILSLLLTGKTTAELTGQPGDAMQTSAAMVAAIINSTMAEDVIKTTGLDIFEVEATEEETEVFSERFRLTMGKELSRRLALKYSFQTEQGELVQRVTTEYKLLEHVLASAFQDNTGIFGGGIRFRLEFY
ncbi:MAG: translocation/assembly module TamB domain-containing protein, partial [Syntrophales bacterium]|nr:translocation/assembly module TamB domain-containing protein [Syntrophales bacterium]